MRLTYFKTIQGISFYNAKKEELIVKKNNNQLIIDSNIIYENVTDFFIDKSSIIININNDCIYYNRDNNLQLLVKNRSVLSIQKDVSNIWLLCNADGFNNLYLYDFNLQNESLLMLDYNWELLCLFWGNIIIYNRHSLWLLKINKNSYEWNCDLSAYKWHQFDGEKPAQINQIVGASENLLLVWMAGEQLLGLDLVTGEVLWKIDFAPYFHITKWFTVFYYWNIENHKLYLLKYLYYFEIDLATQEVKILWQNPDESYSITHCCYTPDYVYFTAFGSELEIQVLGAFNRRSLTIDWLERQTMPRLDAYSYVGFHQAPQVDGSKLYVLDSGGTLHIFEKESD